MGQRRDGDRIEMWDTAEDLNQEYVLKEPKPPFYKHAAYELAKWILLTVVLFLVPVPWYYKIFVGLGLFAIGMIPTMIAMHREDKRREIYADGFKALKEAQALDEAYWAGYLERSARDIKEQMKKHDAKIMAQRNQLNLDFRWNGEKDVPPPKYTAPYHKE